MSGFSFLKTVHYFVEHLTRKDAHVRCSAKETEKSFLLFVTKQDSVLP
jgi:hypothetical protein